MCPLQTIICHCVVTANTVFWRLDEEITVYVDHTGLIYVSNTKYSATVKVLEDELSSNVSFVAELESGPVTLQCQDYNGISTWQYSIVGQFF